MEGVASSGDTAIDARTLARKPRKHVKRGAWSLMMQMPLEVLEKVRRPHVLSSFPLFKLTEGCCGRSSTR